MIEYIKIHSVVGFGNITEIEIFINGDALIYKYSSRGLSAAEKNGKIENVQEFIKKIEEINIYSFKNEYYYENVLIEDGLDFSIYYKESGKPEKEISGQYYPDEVIELLSAIEELIPEALFFDIIDFDEWLEEIIEEMEIKTIDEDYISVLRSEFENAPTLAKKNRLIEIATDNIYEKYANAL